MSTSEFRRCANIKSRSHSDVRCPAPATHGDFCGRHQKKPIRFFDRKSNDQRNIYTRSQSGSIIKLQGWWRRYSSPKKWHRQGPAIFDRSLSQNDTEVYLLEPITTIPQVFFFSYADKKKHIWSFDIRSLLQIMSQGQHLQNPYTREPFPEKIVNSFRSRIEWLRKRKFALLYGLEETMTPEQEWNQRVLDIFMKLEALGYLSNTQWFHNLSIDSQQKYYRTLYNLWYYRLGLSHTEKEEICPGHLSASTRLFRQSPDEAIRSHKEIRWWRRTNLGIIQNLITRSQTKASRGLGALYAIMGFVTVSLQAREAYPWIAESLGIEPLIEDSDDD
jgi:hypothetical protein